MTKANGQIVDAEIVPPSEAIMLPEVQTLGPIGVPDPHKMVADATAMADALAEVIHKQSLYSMIQNRKYVKCEGWTTLGAMLGIVTVEEYVKDIPNGYEARVKLITARDGRLVGGASAICTTDEPTWKSRAPYALRSMALTRATSKAFRLAYSWIMSLAGFEATPAEEMVAADAGGSKEAAQEVAAKKLEEYATTRHEQELIEFTPDDAGMLKLAGNGLSIMRAEETSALDKLMMVWMDGSKCWAIPDDSIVPFVNLCSKHKVSVKRADSSQATPVAPVAPSGVAGPVPGAEHRSAAPGYFPITSLITKTAKSADKNGHDKMLSVGWNGAQHSVATWFFPSMAPLLTECYTNHTPVKLVLAQQGRYSNVVGIEGAEKGDDGVWRFPLQVKPYQASNEDISF